jgi:4-hydroxy-4-methyl-2-oxoglutarate aldolase
MSLETKIDPAATTRRDITRVAPGIIERAREFSSATLHEAAGKIGALPHEILPTAPSFRVCGPAVTVQSPGGDNLWLHRAIYEAQAGDVLVVHTSGRYAHGYWGEIMSTAAVSRGLGGLVIDGCVRDGDLLPQVGLPVFARGFCIRGTGKDFGARGWINAPTMFGDVTVSAGDLIVGDCDGVVCIPRERAADVLDAAAKRETMEADILRRLRAGESTLAVYGWN